MKVIYDPILDELRSSETGADGDSFISEVVTANYTVDGDTTGNLLLVTTGTSEIQVRFLGATTKLNVAYRVYKNDDTVGTVLVKDHNSAVIETLRYHREYIDIQYLTATTYIIM